MPSPQMCSFIHSSNTEHLPQTRCEWHPGTVVSDVAGPAPPPTLTAGGETVNGHKTTPPGGGCLDGTCSRGGTGSPGLRSGSRKAVPRKQLPAEPRGAPHQPGPEKEPRAQPGASVQSRRHALTQIGGGTR